MRFETLWMSESESAIAIPAILNKRVYTDTNVYEFVCIDDFVCRDENSQCSDILDLVNSIDDGYFPDMYNTNKYAVEERKTKSYEIAEFLNTNGEWNAFYAFFIKDRFCGLIKVDLS